MSGLAVSGKNPAHLVGFYSSGFWISVWHHQSLIVSYVPRASNYMGSHLVQIPFQKTPLLSVSWTPTPQYISLVPGWSSQTNNSGMPSGLMTLTDTVS